MYDPVGSLHLAYHDDEWQVLQELYASFRSNRPVELLTPAQVKEKSRAVIPQGLKGALYSSSELIVDPREAIAALPAFLEEKYQVEFHWGKCVRYVSDNTVYVGSNETYEADIIFICSGSDFESLYPEVFSNIAIIKCKLQMMRFAYRPSRAYISLQE